MDTFASRGDDEGYARTGLDPAVLVGCLDGGHVEIVLLRWSVANLVEWGNEPVTAVWLAFGRVQIALVTGQQVEKVGEGGGAYLDFAIVHFGGDACNACWVLLTEIFGRRSFAAVFADE